jgi:hypothetical protein
MDFPTVRGILIECSNSSLDAKERSLSISKLTEMASDCGFLSKNSVKFVVYEDGSVKCKAQQFIPANKHLLHVPFKLDLSFLSLKCEVIPDKHWKGWADLKAKVKSFENDFAWNPRNCDQKDYFSKNIMIAVCIMGALKKINDMGDDRSNMSHLLKSFDLYWRALPRHIGSVLFDWTEDELNILKSSSFYNCLSDAKRFGKEIFHQVLIPFTHQYPEKFGEDIDFGFFMKICTIVSTRSFGTGQKHRKSLLPIIDLVNGKPNEQHNCTLENCAIQVEVNGEFINFHALESSCDINAGDEIYLEYAQVGNSDYLMAYNHIPLDPEVIMNNQRTDVFLDLAEFLDMELLRMHPNTPYLRAMKKNHIYGFFNLPRMIPLSMEDLFSPEYSCIPAIRQVLIFLQFNEGDATNAIESSRIKSQLNPQQLHQLFLLFTKLIEESIGKPNFALFRSLLPNPHGSPRNRVKDLAHEDTPKPVLTDNMRSAIYLQMSERLVVEVMINRFINLFPENFHELGYSIMRTHLVSNEINVILEELMAPSNALRATQCMVCGNIGQMSKCSRCRKAFYCSAGCQKEHWLYHKKVCKNATGGSGGLLTPLGPSTSSIAAETTKASKNKASHFQKSHPNSHYTDKQSTDI